MRRALRDNELAPAHLLLEIGEATAAHATADMLDTLHALAALGVGIAIWASSQSSGTPDQGQIRLGCGITLGGLAIQLICFVIFTILTAWTQRHPK